LKTQLFVLVPDDVPLSGIAEFIRRLLAPHRFDPDEPDSRGRYDYLVGPLGRSFNDPDAESRLPPDLRRAYAGNICERANLPSHIVPGALVTPDGAWHDLGDFGWRMSHEPCVANRTAFEKWKQRYRDLVETHPNCWVVETWAHS